MEPRFLPAVPCSDEKDISVYELYFRYNNQSITATTTTTSTSNVKTTPKVEGYPVKSGNELDADDYEHIIADTDFGDEANKSSNKEFIFSSPGFEDSDDEDGAGIDSASAKHGEDPNDTATATARDYSIINNNTTADLFNGTTCQTSLTTKTGDEQSTNDHDSGPANQDPMPSLLRPSIYLTSPANAGYTPFLRGASVVDQIDRDVHDYVDIREEDKCWGEEAENGHMQIHDLKLNKARERVWWFIF